MAVAVETETDSQLQRLAGDDVNDDGYDKDENDDDDKDEDDNDDDEYDHVVEDDEITVDAFQGDLCQS